MLKNYLYVSDDKNTWERLPDPESYSPKREIVADTNVSESGKDIRFIQRTGKRTVACTFCLTDAKLLLLSSWCDKSGFYLKFYDASEGKDAVAYVHCDDLQPELIRESVNHKAYNGVWNAACTFLEF